MTLPALKKLSTLTTLFFAINATLPLLAQAQVSGSSTIGQTIDASAGALTMPCSLENFSLTMVDINDPSSSFPGYYLNPLTPDADLSSCGGTGITVQDTRYDGGFLLQVTATDYQKVGDPASVIGVENLAIVTEQVSTSYNEDTSGENSFTGSSSGLLAGSAADNIEIAQTLPFTFTFYGQNFTTAYVCSNGEINFQPGQCEAPALPLVDRLTATGQRILPYYKDLTMDDAIDPSFGMYYTSPSATEAKFRWKGAPVSNTSERVDFEVTLIDNGNEDQIAFDYSETDMTDSGFGPIVGITKGGAAGTPVSNTYTDSALSEHATGLDLASSHTLFLSGGFDFTEVKKPGTPAAIAPQKGASTSDPDYTFFTPDNSNPGTSLAIDLINGTVTAACNFTPGRVGIYTVYPSYRLNVVNSSNEGTYQNTITYTVSDSTNPC